VIALLWYLGRRTWSSYESVRPPPADEPAAPGGGAAGRATADYERLPMATPTFWAGRNLIRRLRGIHVAVALATLGLVLVWPALGADRLSGQGGLTDVGWALFGGLVLLLVVAGGLLRLHRVIDRATPHSDPLSLLADWLPRLGLLLILAVGVYLAAPDRAVWPATPALPGYSVLVMTLFTSQVVLLLLVTAVVRAQRGKMPEGAALGGFAAPVVGSIGLLLACAFSAGITYRVADFLDGAATQNQPTQLAGTPLQPPPQFSWAGLGFLLAVVGLVVVAAVSVAGRVTGARLRASELRYAAEVRAAEPGVDPYALDRGRLRSIARTRQLTALTDSAPRLVVMLVVPGAVVTLLVTLGVILFGKPPAALAQEYVPGLAPAASFLTNLGTWLVGAFALALVVLGRAAYRTPSLRRVVGILWDVGTFWPRAAHPLAAPCYAERVVPDLVRRTRWLATPGPDTGQVLLSAHSQGSILAAAVLLQLPEPALGRTRLLTYGCPLSRLYARWFPAYFTADSLREVRARVGCRWRNLLRLTDPIGGWVFAAGRQPTPAVDSVLADPTTFACPDSDTVPPAPRLHSDYWEDEKYGAAVRELVAAPFTEPAPGDAPAIWLAEPRSRAGREAPSGRAAQAAAVREPAPPEDAGAGSGAVVRPTTAGVRDASAAPAGAVPPPD